MPSYTIWASLLPMSFLTSMVARSKTSSSSCLMGFHQDGSAGSLIDAAGLHADNTVLHDIHDADAVLAAQLV